LVAGPAVYICGCCVQRAEQIIVNEQDASLDDLDGKSDDDVLATVARLHHSRDTAERAAIRYVRELRARGVTWARIGETVGISRQSAWERYSGEE
jgi:ATP-dependent Clp protease ATP-binding subunit ClpX